MNQLKRMTVLMTDGPKRVWAWIDGDWAIARHGLDPNVWLIIQTRSGIVCTFCRRESVASAVSVLRAIRVNGVPIGQLPGCELVDVAPIANDQFCLMASIGDSQRWASTLPERQKQFAAQVCRHH